MYRALSFLSLAAVACTADPALPLDESVDARIDLPADARVDAPADAPAPDPAECTTGTRRVYLNRDGGTYRPGAYDASSNTTLRLQTERTFAPWPGDDVALEAVRACVARHVARYDLQIVTTDPGAAEHIEVVLAADTSFALAGDTVYGPATADCSPVRRAVILVDSDVYTGDPRGLCDDIAHGIGDALGLEELFRPGDLMSWQLRGVNRSFRDEDSPCGDAFTKPCRCGGTTQNSHRAMLDRLGACPR